MANPTTNYGFVLPTSTDLVTDLPADFDVALQGVDTRLKALQPGTTLGDIAYSSATANTNTRLGIGTTSQVLTVSGGVPVWATPTVAPAGMTFISRTSFSNVANQAIDSIFSSSYFNYVVVIEEISAATETDDLHLQLRYGSTTITTAVYNGNLLSGTRVTSTLTNTNQNDTNQFTIGLVSGSATYRSNYTINFNQVGNSSERPVFNGIGTTGANEYSAAFFAGQVHAEQTFTGILLKSSSSNITGVVSVYGLAKA
jgi:hypothetical protein